MSFIDEFRKAGLVKSKTAESYVTHEDEKLIKAQQVADEKHEQGMAAANAGGGTTTANVATTAQPLSLTKDQREKLVSSIVRLSEAYEDMTGEKLHEMFCPKCKPYDVSPGTPDKGEPFGPQVPGEKPSFNAMVKDVGAQPQVTF